MVITVEARDGAMAIVRPDVRLDLLSAPALRQRLADEVQAGRRRLVVDLSGVPFIDSSGLGAIVAGLRAARLAGGDLRIARPTAQARTILELTTLDRVLRAYASVEEASADY